MKLHKLAYILTGILVFALVISSCSPNNPQPAETASTPTVESPPSAAPKGTAQTASITTTPPQESPSATANLSVFPTTQIPVTWIDLNLSGKLIFTSSPTEENTITSKIQILDLTTGDIATLFSMPKAWIFYTTVSPDGKWLAMSYSPPAQANTTSNRALYILPLDASSPPQPLVNPPTPDDHYTQVEWSPDGKYIYFVHYNHNQSEGKVYETYQINRMTYPNGAPEVILDHALWPRESGDATKLAYVTLDPDSGRNELWLANSDGSNSQQVALTGASIPEIIDAPLFSPDGQAILFSAPSPDQAYQPNWFDKLLGIQVAEAHNDPSDWWSVPISGGTPTQLTNIEATDLYASLSPDKKYLASVEEGEIFVMGLDGSNVTPILSDPDIHGTVSWIP